ncbi:putative IQ motif, EF-hand binding, P-loop containing nucleoside triphosphate hydrolase [Helianthus annuus]|nr:putative IQ motif, EF-hand binding, P-loop containing nucleoside triphosphate hydrolase [Helianthus annuus]
MHLAREGYKEHQFSAVSIQTGLHGIAARDELRFRRQTKATILIQSHCRKFLARLHFINAKKGTISLQCAWRGKVACKELQKLKIV